MLAAGGPNAIDEGYRKGDQICWAGAGWQPDASANCPKDQPVSACQVTPAQQNYTITLNCGVETPQGGATATMGMANPASVNCVEQGGTLSIVDARRRRAVRHLHLRGQPAMRGVGAAAR